MQSKGRVLLYCDCCRQEFPVTEFSVPELRQRALADGWIESAVRRSINCEDCAISMRLIALRV